MDPFEHEIPSDEELCAYFERKRVYHADPSIWPDTSGAVAEALRLGCDRFLLRVDDVLLAMLRRLNMLPRSHTFWDRNNRRPTLTKIPAFCRLVLSTQPHDILAHWTLAGYDTFSGSDNFGQDHWASLSKYDDFDVAWPVYAGLWNEVMINYGSAPLHKFLVDNALLGPARSQLESFAQSTHPQIQSWARSILSTPD